MREGRNKRRDNSSLPPRFHSWTQRKTRFSFHSGPDVYRRPSSHQKHLLPLVHPLIHPSIHPPHDDFHTVEKELSNGSVLNFSCFFSGSVELPPTNPDGAAAVAPPPWPRPLVPVSDESSFSEVVGSSPLLSAVCATPVTADYAEGWMEGGWRVDGGKQHVG